MYPVFSCEIIIFAEAAVYAIFIPPIVMMSEYISSLRLPSHTIYSDERECPLLLLRVSGASSAMLSTACNGLSAGAETAGSLTILAE